MKNATWYIFFFFFFLGFFPAHAQWFNDTTEGGTSGNVAPCPWVNTTAACNPAGVTNQGLCVTAALGTCSGGTPSGNPQWFNNVSGGVSYGWVQGSAGSAVGYSECTFTYTINVTGVVTITSGSFVGRRSGSGAGTISTFTINGTSYLANLSTTSIGSANTTITYTLPSTVTVTGTLLTIVMRVTGASCTATAWGTRIDDFRLVGTAAPVSLTDFNVKPAPAGVALNWATASETNNDYFAIERSADGDRFEEISRVAGHGNSLAERQYAHTDEHPLNGTSYYRLRQVDYDGEFEYSPVRSVKIGKNGRLSISPNPTSASQVMVYYESSYETDIHLSVINAMGQVVHEQPNVLQKGDNYLSLELPNLPAGNYLIRLEDGTQAPQTQQIIVK